MPRREERDDSQLPRVVTGVASRGSYSSSKEEVPFPPVKKDLSRRRGAEELRLPSSLIPHHRDSGDRFRARPEVAPRPAFGLTRRQKEKDVGMQQSLAARHQRIQLPHARPGARASRVGQHHEFRPARKTLDPAARGPASRRLSGDTGSKRIPGEGRYPAGHADRPAREEDGRPGAAPRESRVHAFCPMSRADRRGRAVRVAPHRSQRLARTTLGLLPAKPDWTQANLVPGWRAGNETGVGGKSPRSVSRPATGTPEEPSDGDRIVRQTHQKASWNCIRYCQSV